MNGEEFYSPQFLQERVYLNRAILARLSTVQVSESFILSCCIDSLACFLISNEWQYEQNRRLLVKGIGKGMIIFSLLECYSVKVLVFLIFECICVY
jgi:hypothetical protein